MVDLIDWCESLEWRECLEWADAWSACLVVLGILMEFWVVHGWGLMTDLSSRKVLLVSSLSMSVFGDITLSLFPINPPTLFPYTMVFISFPISGGANLCGSGDLYLGLSR